MSCFVPGCKTGYVTERKKRKAEGKGYLSLFKAPKEQEKRRVWQIAIKRADRELKEGDKVCELHFVPEDIIRSYNHLLPEGYPSLMRDKPTLKSDAVPTIFPNYPEYLTKMLPKRRKSPSKRIPVPKKLKKDILEDTSFEESIISNNPNGDAILPKFSFEYLRQNLNEVRKPDVSWAVSEHKDFIVCVKWDSEVAPERQIIIVPDLSVQVKYYGKEVCNTDFIIESIQSVSWILKSLNDDYHVCKGASLKKTGCCLLFKCVYGPTYLGKIPQWCSECRQMSQCEKFHLQLLKYNT